MKLKCPILLKPLDTIIQENYHASYPSEPFRITRFKMRHPVEKVWNIEKIWNIQKKIKAKMTKSQLFSMFQFLDGQA